MLVKFDKSLYSKEAIMKTAFAFTDRAYLHLSQDEGHYCVEYWLKHASCEENAKKLGGEIENEALAQTVRQVVLLQTKNIREMILARSLASTIVGEMKADADGILPAEAPDLDQMLTDWFKGNE
jgi:His-Xaa-Ser system protein HxsD